MAGAMTMSVKGLRMIDRELKRYTKEYDKATTAALMTEVVKLDKASSKLVPVDQDPLINSRSWSKPQKDAGGVFVDYGYGTKYALAVHEMPETNNFTKSGTGPKYLEGPWNEAMRGWESRVARNIEGAVKLGRLGKLNVDA